MELWQLLLIVGMAVVLLVVLGVKEVKDKRAGKRPSGSASSALGLMDEMFRPNAAATSLIVEEQREAIVPIPAPEDKPFVEPEFGSAQRTDMDSATGRNTQGP